MISAYYHANFIFEQIFAVELGSGPIDYIDREMVDIKWICVRGKSSKTL